MTNFHAIITLKYKCWDYLQHYDTDYNYAVLQEIPP